MTNDAPVPFSVRSRGPHAHIDRDFPKTGRVGLLHLIDELVREGYVEGWRTIARELRRIARVPPETYGTGVDAGRKAKADAETLLNELPWDRVYDFCERLHGHLVQAVRQTDNYGDYEVTTTLAEVQ